MLAAVVVVVAVAVAVVVAVVVAAVITIYDTVNACFCQQQHLFLHHFGHNGHFTIAISS